jgi:hypothetical protein
MSPAKPASKLYYDCLSGCAESEQSDGDLPSARAQTPQHIQTRFIRCGGHLGAGVPRHYHRPCHRFASAAHNSGMVRGGG